MLTEAELAGSVSIGEWVQAHRPSETLLWKGGVADQVDITWSLYYLLCRRFPMNRWQEATEWKHAHTPRVISTHRSKSVTLPVIYLPSDNISLIMRGNFFNWVVSVDAAWPVLDTFHDLIQRGEHVAHCYAEGFDKEWVYEEYPRNKQRFTTTVPYSLHALWAFVWLLSHQFKVIEADDDAAAN